MKKVEELDEIINYIKNNFPDLKVINSSKGYYKAVHVYFGKGNNYLFQWELQVWLERDQISNLLSHHKYKQDYVKWEKDR